MISMQKKIHLRNPAFIGKRFNKNDNIDEVEVISILPQVLIDTPKPCGMSKSQYYNFLAIEYLEIRGNDFPSQDEISLIENVFIKYSRRKGTKEKFAKACSPDLLN